MQIAKTGRMDQGNPTTEYISNLISAVCPNAQLRILPDYGFLVKTDDSAVEVRFGRAKIDDFAIALERYRNTNYFFTLENHIKFRIYLALGSEGLLDELVISRELINEKGDWLQNIQVDVSFEEEFARTLYEGLKLLDESLTALISRTNVQVPELERDAENIRYLIRYYKENGHLSSRGAKLESLSYLKGGGDLLHCDNWTRKAAMSYCST